MVDTLLDKPLEMTAARPDLDEIMTKIERNCTVVDFSKEQAAATNEAETRAVKAGGVIFDGLMYTLSEIGYVSIEEAKSGGKLSESYEDVARSVEPLSAVCKALADDRLPLKRSTQVEQVHQELGDKVYAYRTDSVTIDGREYVNVRVFIRPRKYIKSLHSRENPGRPRLTLTETADPRLSITMIPKDSPTGEITIRMDEEGFARDSKTADQMITYDIEIGRDDVMDRLDFSGVEGAQTGQRQGHHFSSSWTARELHTSFADILEAFNKKFEAVAQK
ncbi:MAG: hypothetical protein HY376_00100 [Candidatus Blackburnbacteria bacterium]|nr:hypothetical protein [Candidatus Blackburnbacteria bacterium]